MPIIMLSSLLRGTTWETIQYYLLMFLVLCISLSVHEASHGWAAYKLGDDTAYLQGRLTLNPRAHLDPIGTISFLLAGIGWARPVPINPARFDARHSMKKGIVISSLAGPVSNIVLSVVSALAFFITVTVALLIKIPSGNVVYGIFTNFFYLMYFYNIILAVFNLLPVPPLDGFKIFGALLPDRIYYRLMSYERYIGLVFLLLVIFGRGILSNIIQTVSVPFRVAIWDPLEMLFQAVWRALGI